MKFFWPMAVCRFKGLLTTTLLLQLNARRLTAQPFTALSLPLNKFATKNIYNSVVQQHVDVSEALDEGNEHGPQNCCRPLQVIALTRHGIRYPSSKDLNNTNATLTEFANRGVSAKIIKRLQSVVEKFPPEEAAYLAPAGAEEQKRLGWRFGNSTQFATLFRRPNKVAYISSSKPRTKDSMKNFSQGFCSARGWNASETFEERDDLLRFFDHCERYKTEVRRNYSAFHEYHAFRSEMFTGIVQRMGTRLGAPDMVISDDMLSSLYNIAAVEVAAFGSMNWLELLDAEDLNILEYSTDLKQYYKIGYGYPINYEMSCPLITDMFHHMDNVVNNNRPKEGVFYFGHAETVVPVLAALGLFHDKMPLYAKTFQNQTVVNSRKFCTSRIAPFSVNVAFVLYDCDMYEGRTGTGQGYCQKRPKHAEASDDDRYMVQVLFNEKPIRLPFCRGTMCSYSKMRRKYRRYITECDFNRTCSRPNQ